MSTEPEQVEKWISVDDDGTTRTWIVDYGDHGIAGISREAFQSLATKAGMRLSMDVEAEPDEAAS